MKTVITNHDLGCSLHGYDPQTGREVFLTRDGQLTNLYSSSDQVPVGDTEPKFQGAVSTTFTYKGFSLTLAGQYRWGGQVFNQTLIDKVENANLRQNADRRALYSRWQKPGDQVCSKLLTGIFIRGYKREFTFRDG